MQIQFVQNSDNVVLDDFSLKPRSVYKIDEILPEKQETKPPLNTEEVKNVETTISEMEIITNTVQEDQKIKGKADQTVLVVMSVVMIGILVILLW